MWNPIHLVNLHGDDDDGEEETLPAAPAYSVVGLLLDVPEAQRHSMLNPSLVAVVLAAILSFANFGYGTGVMSGAAPILDSSMDLTTVESAMVVTSAVVLAAVGAGVGGPLGDVLGRRVVVILAGIVSAVASVACCLAPTVTLLIGARSLLGFGIGMSFSVVPVYVAETVPPSMRGRVVDLSDFSVVTGQLVSGVVNGLSSSFLPIGADATWRLSVGLGALFPFLLVLVAWTCCVESPRWLVSVGRSAQARTSLVALRGTHAVDDELAAIEKNVVESPTLEGKRRRKGSVRTNAPAESKPFVPAALPPSQTPISLNSHLEIAAPTTEGAQHLQEKSSAATSEEPSSSAATREEASKLRTGVLSTLSTRRVTRALGLGMGIQALTQLSGINAAMYYGADICIAAGFPQEAAIWLSTALTLAQLVGVCISLTTIDTRGRRYTLLRSLIFVTPCLFVLGVAFALGISWLAVTSLVAYLVAFGSGLSGVGYVILSEIFPLEVRGMCVAAGSVTFWIANSAVAFSFPVVSARFGAEYCFFFFATVSLVGFVVLFHHLPETAHKSLEEIDSLFATDTYPMREWYAVGFYGVQDLDEDMRDLGMIAASAELVTSNAAAIGDAAVTAATAVGGAAVEAATTFCPGRVDDAVEEDGEQGDVSSEGRSQLVPNQTEDENSRLQSPLSLSVHGHVATSV